MAWVKGALGGAAGAAMYTAYRDSDAILNSKDLASGLYDYWQKKGQSNLAEVSRLQKNVDDLQHALLKSLHNQQPTVIVAGSSSKSGLNTAAGVVLLVGGVALYLRYVKGWKLSDLMYVTRASLSSLSASMKQSMESVRTELEARAADLMERMQGLGNKQEEMLEAQGQLGTEIALVGGKISAVSEQVSFSNHAILMLCGALSEMAKRVGISNGKYVRELEHLSRTVATTGLPAAAITSAALPLGLPPADPFQSGPTLLTQQPAAQMAGGSGRPNPAIFSLSGGAVSADGTTAAVSGGLGGVSGSTSGRWLSEPQVLVNGTGETQAAGPHRTPAAKPASWFH